MSTVRNLTGHKLPTAYPSRRAWLHVTVAIVRVRRFRIGGGRATGVIAGNDNDADADAIRAALRRDRPADQVQIYESIMAIRRGGDHGSAAGERYVKDNRLLPRGFDKATATPDIAVHGDAGEDADFAGGGDRVRYASTRAARRVRSRHGEAVVPADRLSLGHESSRLRRAEPRRFVRYYESMASVSAIVAAEARATVR